MLNEAEGADILLEAIEVFIYQILYVREVYPQKIFKKRRIYNTPVFASIFPPLNKYICNVLRAALELSRIKELERVELLLYHDEDHQLCERYNFYLNHQAVELVQPPQIDDEFLLEFEEQLRTSLCKLAERLHSLKKLPSNTKFKVLLHTSQSGFVRLSHNPQQQDFPWLYETDRCDPNNCEISLLPLTAINAVGLQLIAEVV